MKGALGLALPPFESINKPPLWPSNITFYEGVCAWQKGRCIGLYRSPRMASQAMIELFKLPANHRANSGGNGLGVRASSNISENEFIGFYACEVYSEDDDFANNSDDDQLNCYLMTPHDDKSTNIYDAKCFGNTLRFINDVRGVSTHPNVYLGECKPLEGAPSWVSIRPIYASTAILKGQELLLDYGDHYWKIQGFNTNYQTCTHCKSVLEKNIINFKGRGLSFYRECRNCEGSKKKLSKKDQKIVHQLRNREVEAPSKDQAGTTSQVTFLSPLSTWH